MTRTDSAGAVRCKICGGSTRFICKTFNEHSRSSHLHNYRCADCGLVFIGDELGTRELGEAYATLDSSVYYEEIRLENAKKLQTSAENLTALVGTDSHILDLGAGNGEFLARLHAKGFRNLAGHEIPGGVAPDADALGLKIYRDHDYQSLPSGEFDVVTLLDVAEHVIDPAFLFRTCYRVLRPGGWVYFHTPVVTWIDRIMHHVPKAGPIWQRGRTSIFHLQNYTDASLKRVLGDAGFGEIRIEVRNELSWPVSRYVRIYLVELRGMPGFLAPVVSAMLYPLLTTDTFNANKAIVRARRPARSPDLRDST